jgi:polysaccharide export outer membrane protein
MKLTTILCTVAAAAVALTSCVTTKQVAYLQDMTHESQIELENKFEAVISPYDELTIIVSSFDKELAEPFNLFHSGQTYYSGNGNGSNYLGYLVDQYGNIEMPVLGTIHAAGLTRLKLQDRIKSMLIEKEYITDPYVMVRFQNFKVFFLGSNGGKAISIPNERCTFLEALALSGDLNVFTNRNKIAVMREVDGKMVMRFLDPRSSKVFDDPFFMLQQNDFIITRDRGYKNFMESTSQALTVLGYVSTLASFATLITSIVLLTQRK